MSKYLIVGAGLAGATLARLLYDSGNDVTIVDKRDHIAGNCYTYKEDNINVHKYGAHIFHTSNDTVWHFVNTFAQFNNFINSPLAITDDNELYNLPFNMNTFSKMFNKYKPDEIKEIINNEINEYKKEHDSITNLEEQAINMVGTTVYKKLVKGYTEKQWGKDCKSLSPDIIKRLPLRMTYDNNYFNDKYQGIPINGYTEMIKNMIKDINITLNIDFKDIKHLSHIYDYIIYTGRIDEYFDYKYGKLDYRSLEFKTLKLSNTDNYQGNAVVNYTGNNLPFTRIIEHKHFNNDKSDNTIITMEFPSNSDIPYYPMSDNKNLQLYNKYEKLAKKQDKVIFAGRLGKYKYFDMDDVIEDCFKIYEDIKNKHNN